MQERSEAERRAIWPCLNVATWRRERSDRAIQQIRWNSSAFHSIPVIRSKGSTSVLSTRKIRPIYSHPVVSTTEHFRDAWWKFHCSRLKKTCTSIATGWKKYPLSNNSRYFSTVRASASVAVVTGLHKQTWFRRLGARASTTVPAHTSCLPISQGIMVIPSGRLPSRWYSPRGSSIEGKSRDPNVCFMTKLGVEWREKRPALLVQERPCKPSGSKLLPQWHQCATQMLAPRRKPI